MKRNSRISAWVVLASMILSLLGPTPIASAVAYDVRLESSASGTLVPGDTFSVDVYIDSAGTHSARGATVELKYDRRLQVTAVTPGSLFPSPVSTGGAFCTYDNAPATDSQYGHVACTLVSTNDDPLGTGPFVTISFTVGALTSVGSASIFVGNVTGLTYLVQGAELYDATPALKAVALTSNALSLQVGYPADALSLTVTGPTDGTLTKAASSSLTALVTNSTSVPVTAYSFYSASGASVPSVDSSLTGWTALAATADASATAATLTGTLNLAEGGNYVIAVATVNGGQKYLSPVVTVVRAPLSGKSLSLIAPPSANVHDGKYYYRSGGSGNSAVSVTLFDPDQSTDAVLRVYNGTTLVYGPVAMVKGTDADFQSISVPASALTDTDSILTFTVSGTVSGNAYNLSTTKHIVVRNTMTAIGTHTASGWYKPGVDGTFTVKAISEKDVTITYQLRNGSDAAVWPARTLPSTGDGTLYQENYVVANGDDVTAGDFRFTFTDRAGNTATAVAEGVNIRTVPPTLVRTLVEILDANSAVRWKTGDAPSPVLATDTAVRFTVGLDQTRDTGDELPLRTISLNGVLGETAFTSVSGATYTYTLPVPQGISVAGVVPQARFISKASQELNVTLATLDFRTQKPSVTASVSGTQSTTGWYTSAPELSVTALAGASVALTYEPGGAAGPNFSSTTTTGTVTERKATLPDGSYTLRVQATGIYGNVSAPADLALKIDTSAPTAPSSLKYYKLDGVTQLPMIQHPTQGLLPTTNEDAVIVELTTSSDVSAIQRLRDGVWGDRSIVSSTGTTRRVRMGVTSNDLNTYQIRAVDPAGNVSSAASFNLVRMLAEPTFSSTINQAVSPKTITVVPTQPMANMPVVTLAGGSVYGGSASTPNAQRVATYTYSFDATGLTDLIFTITGSNELGVAGTGTATVAAIVPGDKQLGENSFTFGASATGTIETSNLDSNDDNEDDSSDPYGYARTSGKKKKLKIRLYSASGIGASQDEWVKFTMTVRAVSSVKKLRVKVYRYDVNGDPVDRFYAQSCTFVNNNAGGKPDSVPCYVYVPGESKVVVWTDQFSDWETSTDETPPELSVSAVTATKNAVVSITPSIAGFATQLTVTGDVNAFTPLVLTGATYTTPFNVTLSTGDGTKSVVVTATDEAGNAASTTLTIVLDSTAPTVSDWKAGLGITYDTGSQKYFSVGANLAVAATVSDSGYNPGGADITLKRTVGTTTTTLVNAVTGGFNTVVPLTANQDVVITVEAKDALGNAMTPQSISVLQDSTAPVVPAEFVSQNVTATTSVALKGLVTDDYLKSVTYSLNNATAVTAGADLSAVTVSGLIQGVNTILVTATDKAGNTTSKLVNVTYDPSVPDVQITTPDTTLNATQPTAVLTITATPTGTLTISRVNASGTSTLEAGPFTVSNGTYSYTTPTLGTAESVTYRADHTGLNGRSNYTTINLVRDGIAPTVTLTPSVTSTADATATLTIGVNETATVTLNGASIGQISGGSTSVQTVNLAEGANAFTVVATDSFGNSTTQAVTVTRTTPSTGGGGTVTTPAPVVLITSPATGLVTREKTVTVSGSATSGAMLTFGVNFVSVLSQTSNGSFSFTATLVEGSNTLTVSAVSGGLSTAASVVVKLDTVAPVVTATLDHADPLSPTATITASTEAGVELFLNGASVGKGSATQTVDLTVGTSTFTLTATDAAGNESEPVVLTAVRRETPAPAETEPTTGGSGTETSDGTIGLVVASGTSTVPLIFTITELTKAPAQPPVGLTVLAMAQFSARDGENQAVTRFAKPVKVQFELPAAVTPSKAVIHWYNEKLKLWLPLVTTVVNGVATAEVDHFTVFALMEETGDLAVELKVTAVGGALRISGTTAKGAEVTLYVNGTSYGDRTATGGTFNRIIWPDAAGTYELFVVASSGDVIRASLTKQAAISAVGAPKPLTDISFTRWSASAIERLAARGIITGFEDSTFRPEKGLTRAEFATLLMRATALSPNEGASASFRDFASIPAWARGAIGAVSQAGLLQGYEDGSFGADRIVTRYEVAVILSRILRADGVAARGAAVAFQDSAKIPGWAAADVAFAARLGLVTGFPDGSFNGSQQLTREQAAAVLDRLLLTLEQ